MPSNAEIGRNPIYLQIADHLRRRIADGTYGPDDQLPTLADLCEQYRCSTTAARMALDVLRSAGLVVGQQGKGTFVRGDRPRQRRIVSHLYAERSPASPLFAAIAEGGREPSLRSNTERLPASPIVAGRLQVEVGAELVITRYRFYADDEPVLLSTSYEPAALTDGTSIELPEESPVTGVVARFDLIDVHIDSVIEHVTARGAGPEEVSALRIPHGVPVMAIERTYFAGATPIETADIVIAGDNYMLTYVVPIPAR